MCDCTKDGFENHGKIINKSIDVRPENTLKMLRSIPVVTTTKKPVESVESELGYAVKSIRNESDLKTVAKSEEVAKEIEEARKEPATEIVETTVAPPKKSFDAKKWIPVIAGVVLAIGLAVLIFKKMKK